MTDLYIVAGDLETQYERVGYMVEDLGPVVVEEVGSYIHGGDARRTERGSGRSGRGRH